MGISVVGCGPGEADHVTPAARSAVREADVVLGSPRLLALFDLGDKRCVELPARSTEAIGTIEKELACGELAVLVSGDPGLFSLGQAVVNHFGREQCRVIPGVSSVQAAFAAIGVDGSEARIISAHGRVPQVAAEELIDCRTLAVLMGTDQAMQWTAGLAEGLSQSHSLFVCENLTLPDQRVTMASAEELLAMETSSLTVLVFVRSDLL